MTESCGIIVHKALLWSGSKLPSSPNPEIPNISSMLSRMLEQDSALDRCLAAGLWRSRLWGSWHLIGLLSSCYLSRSRAQNTGTILHLMVAMQDYATTPRTAIHPPLEPPAFRSKCEIQSLRPAPKRRQSRLWITPVGSNFCDSVDGYLIHGASTWNPRVCPLKLVKSSWANEFLFLDCIHQY